ncbi:hypothetical protein BLA29_008480, partial [Euroglyphus maynei]
MIGQIHYYSIIVIELFVSYSVVVVESMDKLSTNQLPPPYKSYCRFPNHCPDLKYTGIRISQEELRQQFYKCQSDNIERWQITVDHYFTESREFCCFVRTVLSCEQPLLALCNNTYSELNNEDTERLFGKSCNEFLCGDQSETDSNSEMIETGLKICAGIILVVVIGGALYFGYKKVNEWYK